MPTILTHAAVPLALGLGLGRARISGRLLMAGIAAAALPDLDVLAFRFGIGYSHELGHRGISHSLVFALGLALLALLGARRLQTTRPAAFLFIWLAAASHGLLDMLTNGGLGVALFWPLSEQRHFFALRVIEASPLSIRRVFSAAGLPVLRTELLWVWVPCLAAGLSAYAARRRTWR